MLEITRYGSVSPNAGGVVLAVVIYQRISTKPGYLVESSVWYARCRWMFARLPAVGSERAPVVEAAMVCAKVRVTVPGVFGARGSSTAVICAPLPKSGRVIIK